MQYGTGILSTCKVLSKYTFFACMLQIAFAFFWLLVQMCQKIFLCSQKIFFLTVCLSSSAQYCCCTICACTKCRRFVTDGQRALFWHYVFPRIFELFVVYGKSHPRFLLFILGREALFLWDEETSLPFFLSFFHFFFRRKRKGFLSLCPGGKGGGGGGIFFV